MTALARELSWALVVFVFGCFGGTPFGPNFSAINFRRMDPPPGEYALWYAETEECFGKAGRFERIVWWTAEKVSSEGHGALGLHNGDNILIRSDQVGEKVTVRHEMAHHIKPKAEIHFAGGTRALCDGGEG